MARITSCPFRIKKTKQGKQFENCAFGMCPYYRKQRSSNDYECTKYLRELSGK